jgi:hypothetical protein
MSDVCVVRVGTTGSADALVAGPSSPCVAMTMAPRAISRAMVATMIGF